MIWLDSGDQRSRAQQAVEVVKESTSTLLKVHLLVLDLLQVGLIPPKEKISGKLCGAGFYRPDGLPCVTDHSLPPLHGRGTVCCQPYRLHHSLFTPVSSSLLLTEYRRDTIMPNKCTEISLQSLVICPVFFVRMFCKMSCFLVSAGITGLCKVPCSIPRDSVT